MSRGHSLVIAFWVWIAATTLVPFATFAYDGHNQNNLAYDSFCESAVGYGEASVLATGETENRTVGSRVLLAKIAKFLAAKEAPVIIGENMNRVNAYAGKVGGETIDGWLAGRKWTQQLNDEFIATMKAQGRQIQDIGPDFGRRLQNRIDPSFGRPPSSVYGGERQSLLDYGNYQRLYERTGKYQGGVPGFDP